MWHIAGARRGNVLFLSWIYHVHSVLQLLFLSVSLPLFPYRCSQSILLFLKSWMKERKVKRSSGVLVMLWLNLQKAKCCLRRERYHSCHVKSNCSKKALSLPPWWQFHYWFPTPFAALRQIDFHHKVLTWANLSADRAKRKDGRMRPEWNGQTVIMFDVSLPQAPVHRSATAWFVCVCACV